MVEGRMSPHYTQLLKILIFAFIEQTFLQFIPIFHTKHQRRIGKKVYKDTFVLKESMDVKGSSRNHKCQ